MADKFALLLGALAASACLEEIFCTPKPGLVDLKSSGCHRDMDWVTFLMSASALAPRWHLQAQEGLNPCGGMEVLRKNGILMEQAMYGATGGINTHKGLIYAMSLWLFSAGRALAAGCGISASSMAAAGALEVSESVGRDFENIKKKPLSMLTHGERLFLEHGTGGIRLEAASGFPSVVNAGYPAYKHALSMGASRNCAAIYALLAIMAVCEDTNVIHRGGFDFWQKSYIPEVQGALESFRPETEDLSPLRSLYDFVEKNGVSPGGAADLLVCTIFAYNIMSMHYKA